MMRITEVAAAVIRRLAGVREDQIAEIDLIGEPISRGLRVHAGDAEQTRSTDHQTAYVNDHDGCGESVLMPHARAASSLSIYLYLHASMLPPREARRRLSTQ
jgi:hypothetical protein